MEEQAARSIIGSWAEDLTDEEAVAAVIAATSALPDFELSAVGTSDSRVAVLGLAGGRLYCMRRATIDEREGFETFV